MKRHVSSAATETLWNRTVLVSHALYVSWIQIRECRGYLAVGERGNVRENSKRRDVADRDPERIRLPRGLRSFISLHQHRTKCSREAGECVPE